MLTVGDVLEGRYKILDTIDTGGMGTVLLAEHVLIKRKLAIKLLHENLATDPKVVERFMNEASVAGRLGHPNIVESTDMGFTNGHVPFIVFEYLEGALLTNEIYRVKGLTVRRALKIATQIASALDAAHNAGIVHRDLKTDNIFLVQREDVVDHVKVLDFGVSRFIEADDSNLVVGTPEYMAPEQITTPDQVDARADIYALGIVLYEMITARRPFVQQENEPVEELLYRIVNAAPPPLTRGEAPIGLQEMLFTKLLAKDPAERYESMKHVQGAIAAFSGVLRPTPPSIQVPNVEVTPLPGPLPAPPAVPVVQATPVKVESRSNVVPIALLVVGLAVGGAATTLYFGVPPERTTSGTVTTQATIDADATQLAGTIEAAGNANLLRAESMAMSPMLRAAIETDRATLQNMLKDGDLVIEPKPNEILRIYQRRDKDTLILQIPEDAPALASAPTGISYASKGGAVTATAGVMTAQKTGVIVISAPVDLAPATARIAEHVLHAKIIGLGEPVVLVDTATDGRRLVAPIKVGNTTPTLEVLVTRPTTTETDRFATLRLALWGIGGLLALCSLLWLLLRRR